MRNDYRYTLSAVLWLSSCVLRADKLECRPFCYYRTKTNDCKGLFQFGPNAISISRREQNGGHFATDVFECVFLGEKCSIFVLISVIFCGQGPNS